jgi:glycine/sarcosine N-methyltransferase
MSNEQNKFYTSISKYYSEIFPYNPIQLQFVKNSIGNLSGKQILDIGCATGELAFNLAKESAKVTGIDLNEDLLKQAKTKKKHSNLQFQKGNMLELENDFQERQFDAVLCFGNTMVHLLTTNLIQQMLNGVNAILKPGGMFLMQILNYDYILNEQISELPIIETENIKFVRNYEFGVSSPIVRFKTDLHLKKGSRVVSNETSLLALKSTELINLLENSGFKNIELFSNFKKKTFGGSHLPLAITCCKK